MAIGKQPIMPDAVEAFGKDVHEKAPDKLMGLHAHGLPLIALAPIAIREAYAAVTDLTEAMIGKRDAVGIAPQIVAPLGWPRARLLGLHHPRLVIELVEERGEACGRLALG